MAWPCDKCSKVCLSRIGLWSHKQAHDRPQQGGPTPSMQQFNVLRDMVVQVASKFNKFGQAQDKKNAEFYATTHLHGLSLQSLEGKAVQVGRVMALQGCLFSLSGLLQGGQFEMGYGVRVSQQLRPSQQRTECLTFGQLLQRVCLGIVFGPDRADVPLGVEAGFKALFSPKMSAEKTTAETSENILHEAALIWEQGGDGRAVARSLEGYFEVRRDLLNLTDKPEDCHRVCSMYFERTFIICSTHHLWRS